jgi:UPF0755 protein
MLKKKTAILSIIILCLLLTFFLLVRDIYQFSDKPAGTNTEEKVLMIKPGQNITQISATLHEMGIIDSPFKFKMLSRLEGMDKKLKTGEYAVSKAMSPNTILNKIVNGRTILYRVTVPEGYNLYQISTIIAKSNLETFDAFYRAASDPILTRKLGVDADTFEGYLFPDTYFFPKTITSRKIIQTMLNRFRTVFKKEWKERAKQMGFSIHQIVTLASIIEKETGVPLERPIISSVFHNRLKKGMRLESDPTVIYSIQNFDGNITREHLSEETPYNTYKIRGLPPGPIANPGKKALEAALFPENTPYLYFVSKRDKTHKFSTNIKEHNLAVRKYQLLRR